MKNNAVCPSKIYNACQDCFFPLIGLLKANKPANRTHRNSLPCLEGSEEIPKKKHPFMYRAQQFIYLLNFVYLKCYMKVCHLLVYEFVTERAKSFFL